MNTLLGFILIFPGMPVLVFLIVGVANRIIKELRNSKQRSEK